jgi:hypothetical protein
MLWSTEHDKPVPELIVRSWNKEIPPKLSCEGGISCGPLLALGVLLGHLVLGLGLDLVALAHPTHVRIATTVSQELLIHSGTPGGAAARWLTLIVTHGVRPLNWEKTLM